MLEADRTPAAQAQPKPREKKVPMWAKVLKAIQAYGTAEYKSLGFVEKQQLTEQFKQEILLEEKKQKQKRRTRSRAAAFSGATTSDFFSPVTSPHAGGQQHGGSVTMTSGPLSGSKAHYAVGRGPEASAGPEVPAAPGDEEQNADLLGCAGGHLGLAEEFEGQNGSFITGQHGRRVRAFASIPRVAEIPAGLQQLYQHMAEDMDLQQANQYDFVKHNIEAVKNPNNVRLTAMARDIHMYRFDPAGRHPRNYQQFY